MSRKGRTLSLKPLDAEVLRSENAGLKENQTFKEKTRVTRSVLFCSRH